MDNTPLSNIKAKIRYWESLSSRWIFRNFYTLFFEILLLAIFVIFFTQAIHVIGLMDDVSKTDIIEQLLLSQSINILIIVILLLLNSFLMLFIFNSVIRFRPLLKEISYNTGRPRKPYAGPSQKPEQS